MASQTKSSLDWLPVAIGQRSTVREIDADEYLFRQGNKASAIFEVEYGRLQLIRCTSRQLRAGSGTSIMPDRNGRALARGQVCAGHDWQTGCGSDRLVPLIRHRVLTKHRARSREGLIMDAHVHRTHHTGWLRASVLGANDGVLSISSLVLGVAAAQTNQTGIMVASVAGLVAGALSMGAGEYVSVSSQADTERADLEIERIALQDNYDHEHAELAGIYVRRGLDPELASRVAEQLMAHDALGAHARDDIGISDALAARPLQAAVTSSISFAVGGIVPLLVAVTARGTALIPAVAVVALVFLAALGASAARAGGAPIMTGALRVLVWGALAMGVTGAVGALFGSVV